MRNYLKAISLAWLVCFSLNPILASAENHKHEHGQEEHESFGGEHHHAHGFPKANFIPGQILNPDDSEYQAPEATANYVGLYTAQVKIDELEADLHLILNIQEDGLFNLAYYYRNIPENRGVRFYATDEKQIEKVEAVYQDLIILTAALREGEGSLGSGLIGETISPVVLLNQQGKAEELYAYKNMAYGLRENQVNARVYQNVGLYIVDETIAVDINHLIGLASAEQIVAEFELVEGDHADQFLVEKPVFELLQSNFDTYLIEHNDFKMSFNSVNEFVQKVLTMHLETNTSFPQDTKVELIEPENLMVEDELEITYALLINETILYASDEAHLYMTTEFSENENTYTVSKWQSN